MPAGARRGGVTRGGRSCRLWGSERRGCCYGPHSVVGRCAHPKLRRQQGNGGALVHLKGSHRSARAPPNGLLARREAFVWDAYEARGEALQKSIDADVKRAVTVGAAISDRQLSLR